MADFDDLVAANLQARKKGDATDVERHQRRVAAANEIRALLAQARDTLVRNNVSPLPVVVQQPNTGRRSGQITYTIKIIDHRWPLDEFALDGNANAWARTQCEVIGSHSWQPYLSPPVDIEAMKRQAGALGLRSGTKVLRDDWRYPARVIRFDAETPIWHPFSIDGEGKLLLVKSNDHSYDLRRCVADAVARLIHEHSG